MAFRFVHTADVHLDSPLRSLALRDPDLASLIGNATRRAFTKIIDLCLSEKVDALVIAGDLYDGDQTSMRTALFLQQELKRLDVAGIRTFVIRGNHDHLARVTRELDFPDSVRIFGGRADLVPIEADGGLVVAIHGLSFSAAHAPESLLPKYKAPLEGAVNLGIMHTSLDGSSGHNPYAPCSSVDLDGSGFRYWALGHIHLRAVAGTACTIAMPGMPQGRDVGESGPKTATVVTVSDDGSIAVEEHLTSLAQFERVTVDVGDVLDWRGLATKIGTALAAARGETKSEHLVARLTLTGATPLAWRMRRDGDLLHTEAIARASALGSTWLDKIEVRVTPPDGVPDGPGPVAELRRSIHEDVLDSHGYREAVRAAMDEVRTQLPAEIRGILGDDETSVQTLVERLSAHGCDEVLARLMATEGSDDAA